jgi:hypothetical protein
MSLGLLKGVSETDLAVGYLISDLLFESVITNDELQFVITRHMLDLFLDKENSTGSPRSIRALKLPL